MNDRLRKRDLGRGLLLLFVLDVLFVLLLLFVWDVLLVLLLLFVLGVLLVLLFFRWDVLLLLTDLFPFWSLPFPSLFFASATTS